jgi:hypothetical protein
MVPAKGNILPATPLDGYLSPVVFILPHHPRCELFARFEETNAGAGCRHSYAPVDERHCGPSTGELLFAVLNQYCWDNSVVEDPVAGKPDIIQLIQF